MHSAHRLASCAALLLAAATPLAHALDASANAGPYAAAIESAGAPDALSARVPGGGGVDYAELAGGLAWRSAYARYDTMFTHDVVGMPDMRGTACLDLGARHAFGAGLLLKRHAADSRVAGSGSSVWNWRDLAAGLSSRLEGGWVAAVNLGRAIGGAGGSAVHDRYGSGNVHADGRPWGASAGRRTLVMSLARRF